jgi:hypothetical protein
MDDIEFLRTYNSACDAAEQMDDASGKRAVQLLLQLVNSLREQIEDMHVDEC